MIPYFTNDKITIYRYTETGDYDEDGEAEYTYEKQNTYSCDIQIDTASSENNEVGEIQKNTYKIFLDIDVDVKNEDVLVPASNTNLYLKVNGNPANWNHKLLNHIEIKCKELRSKPRRLVL